MSLIAEPAANFILSVPLLLCMGSADHGLPF